MGRMAEVLARRPIFLFRRLSPIVVRWSCLGRTVGFPSEFVRKVLDLVSLLLANIANASVVAADDSIRIHIIVDGYSS
jgi:hypothetical protein